MSGKRRTELIDVFKAEAANVKALAMQALDADIILITIENSRFVRGNLFLNKYLPFFSRALTTLKGISNSVLDYEHRQYDPNITIITKY